MTDSIDADGSEAAEQARIEAVVAQGPAGTFAVAGVASAIVIGLWVAFYFFAYLPRGVIQ